MDRRARPLNFLVSENPMLTTKIIRLSSVALSSTVSLQLRRHHEHSQTLPTTFRLDRVVDGVVQQHEPRRKRACDQPAMDGHVRSRTSVRHAGGAPDIRLIPWRALSTPALCPSAVVPAGVRRSATHGGNTNAARCTPGV